jgi:hypothetical protein
MAEPEASMLVTRHTLSPRSQRLYIRSADATVAPRGHEGQVTSLAEVNDVLARGVEDLGRFASGEQVFTARGENRVNSLNSHASSLLQNARNTIWSLEVVFLGIWVPIGVWW